MAKDGDINAGEEATLDPSPPPPNFPNGRRPSSGTDIGFEESTSGSELAPSEATIDEALESSAMARGSTLKRGSKRNERGSKRNERGSKRDEPDSGRRRTSNSGSILKPQESIKDGRPPRKQWGSGRVSRSKGLDGVNLDNPEVKELLRRLKEAEASSSSSSDHVKLASPKPGEHHRGIKALHRAVQENEMPMRMAYEQLDELAANAERVKFAIERNRSLLTLQVKKTNERLLRVAFMVWSLETEYQKQKKLMLRRAFTWSIRSLLSRAFRGWRSWSKLGKKTKRFEASVVKILQRRKVGLAWKAWRNMVAEVQRADEDIKTKKRLRKNIDKRFEEGLAERAVSVMRRSQLRRYFHFFQEGIEARIQAREFLRQILILLLKKLAFRAFVALRDAARKRAHDQGFIKARLRLMLLRRCLKGWWKLIPRNAHLRRSGQDDRLLRSAFHKWATWIIGRKNLRERWRNCLKKLDRNMRNRMFMAFVDVVGERKRVRGLVTRQLKKTNRRLLNRCFQGWISFMQMGAQKKMQHVQRLASTAQRENKKLRTDNERLSTIIDTGDWNKDRVSDLVAAQQVLSAERVALTKLIGRLQRQHQLALDQQEKQEHEIKHLKDQLMSENKLQRNKLLVKGASSFNTLMRVMKHDMLKRATTTTPEVIYEVNNMAMDQVTVFPDGEIHVKAMKTRNKGRWTNVILNSGTPSVTSIKPPGSSRSHTPRTSRVPDPPHAYARYSYNT